MNLRPPLMNVMELVPLFLLLITTTTLIIPTSFSQEEESWYNSCGSLFSCGNLTNVSFPFWGNSRPKNCGHPNLQIHCNTTTNTPTIQIQSLQYRILGINPNDTTLKISRLDLSANTCPATFTNTTLDFTVLDYASGYNNITIFYGCQPPYGSYSYQFTCPVKGTNYTDSYVGVGSQGPDDVGCTDSVVVPVQGGLANVVGSGGNFSLAQGIEDGFEVDYKVDNVACIACVATEGRCGYDWSKKVSVCLCPAGTIASDNTCIGTTTAGGDNAAAAAASGSNSSRRRVILIGLSVGIACVAASAFICASIFILRRRTRQLVMDAERKDNTRGSGTTTSTATNRGIIPSSKGYITATPTTTNYSGHTTTSSYHHHGGGSSRGGVSSSYFGVRLFSYDELEEATSHFDEARELGDGGFGTVYYGKLSDGRLVAVKRLYENSLRGVEQFMNEIEILARLRHKNLVALYGCTSRRSRELLLVYEYISNGTVADHIHRRLAEPTHQRHRYLPWPIRVSIAVETADALAFLHASDVIHRDVKTTNILLDDTFCVKVADFGLSRLFPNDVTHVSTAPQGTPGYVDPEYYQCYHLTEKSDVYSFGVVLVELISSKHAVDITRHRHHINLSNLAIDKIQNHGLDDLVDPNLGYDTDYGVQKDVRAVAELAFRCLQQERDMRPTMQQVLDALREIKKELMSREKQEVVDIINGREGDDDDDDGGGGVGGLLLLKHHVLSPPLSPPEPVGGST